MIYLHQWIYNSLLICCCCRFLFRVFVYICVTIPASVVYSFQGLLRPELYSIFFFIFFRFQHSWNMNSNRNMAAIQRKSKLCNCFWFGCSRIYLPSKIGHFESFYSPLRESMWLAEVVTRYSHCQCIPYFIFMLQPVVRTISIST